MSRNKKQLTKGELQDDIEQARSHIQQLYRIMGEMNTRLIAIAQAKVTPEVLAKFIMDEPSQDAFMKNLNLAIDAEIEKKKEAEKPTEETKAVIEKAKL
jgi:hypothetical protein